MSFSRQKIENIIEIAINERKKMHNLRTDILGNSGTTSLRKRKRDNDAGYNLASISRNDKIMECIAYDDTTGFHYVGYSGVGNPVTSGRLSDHHSHDKVRRLNRISSYIANVHSELGRDVSQCAEAAALSVALSWGANFKNLTFVALNKHNQVQNPCSNCIQYITNYINEQHQHVEPK